MHEAAIANGHGWVARQYHRQTMKLDPVSLRLFVAVMEESTIAAAAEREHLAASAVSRRLADLEDALRVDLFTRSTKTRGEVSGGGKKPFKQKGTGRARAGSTRSPLWSGGGVVFGPRPQDFSQKINAKVKNLALRRAFFDRAVAGEIEVIERFEAASAKTKEINSVVGRIAPEGKILIVDAPFGTEVRRAASNLERVFLQDATQLNTLDLTQYRKVILSEKALENVIARMKGGN